MVAVPPVRVPVVAKPVRLTGIVLAPLVTLKVPGFVIANVEPELPVTVKVPATPGVVADKATVPVAERAPPVVITTVPPALFAANVPKFKAVPALIDMGTMTVALAVPVTVAATAPALKIAERKKMLARRPAQCALRCVSFMTTPNGKRDE